MSVPDLVLVNGVSKPKQELTIRKVSNKDVTYKEGMFSLQASHNGRRWNWVAPSFSKKARGLEEGFGRVINGGSIYSDAGERRSWNVWDIRTCVPWLKGKGRWTIIVTIQTLSWPRGWGMGWTRTIIQRRSCIVIGPISVKRNGVKTARGSKDIKIT